MNPLLWLALTLAAIWLLGVLLARHTQGLALLLTGSPRTATAVYDLLVLPGVVLHELAHALVALAVGVRVVRIDLFRFRSLHDPRQGEVVVNRSDPFRMSLIGAAPLLIGLTTLVALVGWINPPTIAFDLNAPAQLYALLDDWRAAVGLYLLVAIANTMFPSAADRRAWWAVGLALAIMAVVLLLLGVRPELPGSWITLLQTQSDRLVAALRPVIVIDLICLVVVIAAERLIGRVRGRRVLYRV